MKVLHICQRDDPATGGAARVAVELAKSLPRHGVGADCVFVYGKPGPFSEELAGHALHLRLNSSRDAWHGVHRLRQLIIRGGWEIVHHHDGLIWTHGVSGRCRDVTVVGHGHLSPPPPSGRWRIRLAHRIQAARYDHLFAVSEETRADWIAQGFPAEKASVLANGVDLSRFAPSSAGARENLRKQWNVPVDSKVLGFVGRLDSGMKGCPEFVELIARLPERFFGIMAGEGPDRTSLEYQARSLGIGHRIHFTGLVDPAQEVYPGLDVFVMTSRYEPFGLVLLEAAASGIPIAILPGSGGAVSLGRKLGAIILSDRSIDSLAGVVGRIACGDEGQRRVCEEALRPFSWDRVAATLASRYEMIFRR